MVFIIVFHAVQIVEPEEEEAEASINNSVEVNCFDWDAVVNENFDPLSLAPVRECFPYIIASRPQFNDSCFSVDQLFFFCAEMVSQQLICLTMGLIFF